MAKNHFLYDNDDTFNSTNNPNNGEVLTNVVIFKKCGFYRVLHIHVEFPYVNIVWLRCFNARWAVKNLIKGMSASPVIITNIRNGPKSVYNERFIFLLIYEFHALESQLSTFVCMYIHFILLVLLMHLAAPNDSI